MIEPKWRKIVRYLALFVIVGGALPIFLEVFGIGFLPSQEWVGLFGGQLWVLSLFTGVALTRFFITQARYRKYKPRRKLPKKTAWFAWALAAAGIVIVTQIFMLNAIPMVHSLVVAEQVQRMLTVEAQINLRYSRSGICRYSLEVEELPIFANKICGRATQGFSAGDRVVITGSGGSLGMFISDFRLGARN